MVKIYAVKGNPKRKKARRHSKRHAKRNVSRRHTRKHVRRQKRHVARHTRKHVRRTKNLKERKVSKMAKHHRKHRKHKRNPSKLMSMVKRGYISEGVNVKSMGTNAVAGIVGFGSNAFVTSMVTPLIPGYATWPTAGRITMNAGLAILSTALVGMILPNIPGVKKGTAVKLTAMFGVGAAMNFGIATLNETGITAKIQAMLPAATPKVAGYQSVMDRNPRSDAYKGVGAADPFAQTQNVQYN